MIQNAEEICRRIRNQEVALREGLIVPTADWPLAMATMPEQLVVKGKLEPVVVGNERALRRLIQR